MFTGLAIVFGVITTINANYLMVETSPELKFQENQECHFKGKNIYPGDCRKYYYCQEGVLRIKKCFFLKRFDPAQKKCHWLFFVNCNNNVSPTTSPPSTEETIIPASVTQNPAVQTSTSSVTEKGDHQCNFHGNDVFPEDCRKYYHCHKGELQVKRCFFLKRFDPIKKQCRWFFFVRCRSHVQPTSPTPTSQTTESTMPPSQPPTNATEKPINSSTISETPDITTGKQTISTPLSTTTEFPTGPQSTSTEITRSPSTESSSARTVLPTQPPTTKNPLSTSTEATVSTSSEVSPSAVTASTTEPVTATVVPPTSTEITTGLPTSTISSSHTEITVEPSTSSQVTVEPSASITTSTPSTSVEIIAESSSSTVSHSTPLSNEKYLQSPQHQYLPQQKQSKHQSL